jgi:hypothetical protein
MFDKNNMYFAAFTHQSLLRVKCFIAKFSLHNVDLRLKLNKLRIIFNPARNLLNVDLIDSVQEHILKLSLHSAIIVDQQHAASTRWHTTLLNEPVLAQGGAFELGDEFLRDRERYGVLIVKFFLAPNMRQVG